MVAWSHWLEHNWFSLIQSLGIIGGLLFTGWTFRQTGRESRAANTLSLAQHHRELWAETHRRPELSRLLAPQVDLQADPITPAEREFLDVAIYHFNTCWNLAREDGLVSLKALRLDAVGFFARPIPKAVWRETRATRNPAFVAFIEDAIGESSTPQ